MATSEYGVISADSHVIEPHDLWQMRVESKFKARAPRLVHGATTDLLECDQAELPPVGLLAGCARSDEEVRADGRWEEDVFPGGYDPKVRLGDLDRDGVTAEVVCPTIGMQFYPINDADFQWALFRAYNTWLGEEFCGAYPDRFKGVAMINHEDTDAAIAEVKRCKDLGLVGIMLPLREAPRSCIRFSRRLKPSGWPTRSPPLLPGSGTWGAVSRFGDIHQALGYRWTPAGRESLYLRSKALVDARAAGIRYPISGMWGGALDDVEGLRTWANELRDLGYYGMMIGAPAHVPIVHEVFSPTAADIAYWRDLDRLATEAESNGSGPIRYGDANQGEGHVVHLAHVGSARMNLEWARALGLA